MTSTRLILIFLGFILVIVAILTSNRIASALRERFGKYIPGNLKVATDEVTPTPTIFTESSTPTPTYVMGNIGSPSSTIPATGPNDSLYFVLGISLISGLVLRKVQSESKG